jgi:hypothetical protein
MHTAATSRESNLYVVPTSVFRDEEGSIILIQGAPIVRGALPGGDVDHVSYEPYPLSRREHANSAASRRTDH